MSGSVSRDGRSHKRRTVVAKKPAPVKKIQAWILYDGTKLTLFEGKVNDKKKKISGPYDATSGASGFQKSTKANLKKPDKGPVPEGLYKVNLRLCPTRLVRNSGVNTVPGHGLEILDWSTIIESGWGLWRARLDKSKVKTSRDNFYLHNSYKGESHGCIETETELYYDLVKYKYQKNTFIYVKVKYKLKGGTTNGGTLKNPRPWYDHDEQSADGTMFPAPKDGAFPDMTRMKKAGYTKC